MAFNGKKLMKCQVNPFAVQPSSDVLSSLTRERGGPLHEDAPVAIEQRNARLCTTDRCSAIFKDRPRPQAFNLAPDRRSRLYACGTPVRRFAQSRHEARGAPATVPSANRRQRTRTA